MNNKNLIYGFHSINSALLNIPEKVEVLYYMACRQDKRITKLLELAQKNNIILTTKTAKELDELSHYVKHQGVIAIIKENMDTALTFNLSLKDLLSELNNQTKATLLMLDGVTDTHNLGAIIRTAECLGVNAIILAKNNSAPINATVYKASAGAINYIPVIVVNNLVSAIDIIKAAGFWVYGTHLTENSVNLYDLKVEPKSLWIMGSEDKGLRRLVSEECDYLVKIPLIGKTQSLNVSVATGIVLSKVNQVDIS